MSHLRNHASKQNTKKIILIVIGIAVLAIISIQVGLPALINATVFINGISSDKKTQDEESKNDSSFFGTLYVSDLPTATNSAELYVSGETSDFDTLTFLINNTKVEEIKLNKDSFNQKIGKLKVGKNSILVKATANNGKHSKESEIYTVVYMNKPPTLEVTTPGDNETKTKQELSVEGKTDVGVTVRINNQPVVVDVQGNFKKSIRLKEGENTLEVIAEDDAGNQEKKEIKVKYQKDE